MQRQEGGGGGGEEGLEQHEWELRQRESETPGDSPRMLQVGSFRCARDVSQHYTCEGLGESA